MPRYTKICKKCKKEKSLSDFYKDSSKKDGLQNKCKECCKKYYQSHKKQHKKTMANWRKMNPVAIKKHQLTTRYKIPKNKIEDVYKKVVNGQCMICGAKARERSLHVDHDHSTGKIRGVLCVLCNSGIGKLKESKEILLKAITYLESPPGL